ncbi:MAG: hypothetical protein HY951_15480 [Bacteroidia bacterium]|nr:hypothetical protein [Bacteroidia bacterium]
MNKLVEYVFSIFFIVVSGVLNFLFANYIKDIAVVQYVLINIFVFTITYFTFHLIFKRSFVKLNKKYYTMLFSIVVILVLIFIKTLNYTNSHLIIIHESQTKIKGDNYCDNIIKYKDSYSDIELLQANELNPENVWCDINNVKNNILWFSIFCSFLMSIFFSFAFQGINIKIETEKKTIGFK